MQPFDFQSRTRLVFGEGSIERLGDLAEEFGFCRTLLVADPGIVACGYVERATRLLDAAGITVLKFHDFDSNPNTTMIESGRAFAANLGIDSIIGLGGGSSMDCAKGINFLLTGGGEMRDYLGYGKAPGPMLPMLGIPTTAGTGSEAQSYALICDADTHVKMACGDPGAAFKAAILDPSLTISQPATVTASAGFDAIAHAVETYVTTRRSAASELFSLEAWRLLEGHYERVIADPQDLNARSAMLLGAHWAGLAIENSMLGAAHACANPLTANYATEHGIAVGLMLPHVVRWNGPVAGARYGELLQAARHGTDRTIELAEAAELLGCRLEQLLTAGGLPRRLREARVQAADIARLADEAAAQWTGQFNPRGFGASAARELYERAF